MRIRRRQVAVALLPFIIACGGLLWVIISNFEEIEQTTALSEALTTTDTATTTTTTITTTMATTTTTITTTTTTTTTTVVTVVATETTTTEVVAEVSAVGEPEYGSDAYLLAYAMSREAAYGDYTDATYVANVILNRVDDPDFPDTILEVLQAPNQYPWGVSYYSKEYIYDTEFFRIAEDLLEGERPLPNTVVYQAQFVQGSGIYCQWGNHYYCYK